MEGKRLERLLETETRRRSTDWVDTEALAQPYLSVLWHGECERIGDIAPLARLTAGDGEALSRREPTFAAPGSSRLLPLADPHLSRSPLVLRPWADGIEIDPTGTSTTVWAEGETLRAPRRFDAAAIDRGVVLELGERVVVLLHRRRAPAAHAPRFGLVGESDPIHTLRRDLARVVDLEVPILVRGPTGSGKELVAHALHGHGPRSRGPWVPVNMGALAPSLAAAELFGSQKGAFTGAERSRPGFFQQADRGTLFLDEIAEASNEVQASLLRALENGEVQRVGGQGRERIDVRLVTATDADLEQAVVDGRFRAPLLHRIAGTVLEVPSLASRRDDLGRLLLHFLRIEMESMGARAELARLGSDRPGAPPWLPARAVARLARLDWPGNVRQLRNVARQLAIAGRGREAVPTEDTDRILAPLEAEARTARNPEGGAQAAPAPQRPYRDAASLSEEQLEAALESHAWRVRPTAEALGVSRTALYARIERSPRVRKAFDLGADEIEAALARHRRDLPSAAAELRVSLHGLKKRMTHLGLG